MGRRVGSALVASGTEGAVATSFEDILYEVADARATITINRPDRLNAFRSQTIRELAEASRRPLTTRPSG